MLNGMEFDDDSRVCSALVGRLQSELKQVQSALDEQHRAMRQASEAATQWTAKRGRFSFSLILKSYSITSLCRVVLLNQPLKSR
ncbi:hypothetical protein TYRP_005610 [Tyrophagus putrescentiae]|nr:hypothetical protein TYRP_005610 [Tyrophagus putrescentiae]